MWALLHVTLLASNILRWLLEFGEISVPLTLETVLDLRYLDKRNIYCTDICACLKFSSLTLWRRNYLFNFSTSCI